MEIDIYMGKKSDNPKERLFVFVPKGQSIELLPPDASQDLGKLIYQKSINILAGEKRIALDADKAIEDIADKGYYIQGVKMTTQISTSIP